jgi:hypothetical protein
MRACLLFAGHPMRNAQFWAYYIRATYLDQLSTFRDVALNHVLPSMPDIVIDKAFTEAGEHLSSSSDSECDPGDVADRALDQAIDKYVMRMWVRQGVSNLLAVGLHHLVEQQMLHLLRRELLLPLEENQHELFEAKNFYDRSCSAGICPGEIADWKFLKELKLVANAVKHAEGSSAVRLRGLRPELFQKENILDAHYTRTVVVDSNLYQPLFGEGLFVKESDVEFYIRAAENFWREYSLRLLSMAS